MEPVLAAVVVLDLLVINTSTPAANDDAPADSTISPPEPLLPNPTVMYTAPPRNLKSFQYE